jgi:hypothetical protein
MLEAELGACKHLCSGSLILRCTICKYMCVVGFMTCHQLKRNRPTRLHAFQRFRFVVRNTASGQSSSVALCWRHCTQKCNKSSAAKAGCSSQTSLACVDCNACDVQPSIYGVCGIVVSQGTSGYIARAEERMVMKIVRRKQGCAMVLLLSPDCQQPIWENKSNQQFFCRLRKPVNY